MKGQINSTLQCSHNRQNDYRIVVLLVMGFFICAFHFYRFPPHAEQTSVKKLKNVIFWLQTGEEGHFYSVPKGQNIFGTPVIPSNYSAYLKENNTIKDGIAFPPQASPILLKPIDINKASIVTLATLPGIGENIAKRIVDYRIKNGFFMDINQLRLVKGVGVKKFEKLAGLIKI